MTYIRKLYMHHSRRKRGQPRRINTYGNARVNSYGQTRSHMGGRRKRKTRRHIHRWY